LAFWRFGGKNPRVAPAEKRKLRRELIACASFVVTGLLVIYVDSQSTISRRAMLITVHGKKSTTATDSWLRRLTTHPLCGFVII